MPNSQHPFSSDTFNKNLDHTINDIAIQVAHALAVNGRARSSYYRAAILLATACVEATLYEYITQACQQDPAILNRVKRFRTSRETNLLVELPKAQVGTTKELWVCEINRTKIDRTNHFKEMNDFCLEAKLINKRLHQSLERVREKRNEIHLQTLQSTARNYNNKILEQVSATFFSVLSKLESL